jgi:transposase-like protein
MMNCPECGSDKIIKAGFNVTRQGKKQKLKCQNCGRIFYLDKETDKP